ncbi:transformer-2 -like protein [Brachionus plicatilis]|uniref:Transformer-2-like protein n=1 Tax=Brachionus plicatilis TaxID=10195 RepID=A0A3M7P7Q2_BRAPC|nr:transformer-2 -like protein [Brachionus plicatilis]
MIETNTSQSLSRDHSLESAKPRSPRRRHDSHSRRRRSHSRYRYRSRSRSHCCPRSRNARPRSPYLRSTKHRVEHRDEPDRFNPPKNDILAVFGLDRDTNESDLFNFFKKYGCKRSKVIFDKRTGKPRGFGFVYFDCIDDASRAKRATNGKRLLSRELRVDYSIGERSYASNRQGLHDKIYGYQSNAESNAFYGY